MTYLHKYWGYQLPLFYLWRVSGISPQNSWSIENAAGLDMLTVKSQVSFHELSWIQSSWILPKWRMLCTYDISTWNCTDSWLWQYWKTQILTLVVLQSNITLKLVWILERESCRNYQLPFHPTVGVVDTSRNWHPNWSLTTFYFVRKRKAVFSWTFQADAFLTCVEDLVSSSILRPSWWTDSEWKGSTWFRYYQH